MAVRKRSTSVVEQVLEEAENNNENSPFKEPPIKLFLSTGCTLFNCCISDKWDGGWASGRISNPVGDSDTGKTLIALSSLAEAANNESFDDYDLYFADCESAIAISGLEDMFGSRFQDRVIILSPNNEDPEDQPPETIEKLHYQLLDLFDSGRKFVYVLDSLDHIPSKDELDKTEEQREADRKGKDTSGTYGMSKQKYLKKMFREIGTKLMETDSFILIISQTIANVGPGFAPKSRAGGSGLDFSSRVISWFKPLEVEKVKERRVARKVEAKVSKNHITYKKREVQFWVADGLGIDDVRSNIEFLVKEKVWDKSGAFIVPHGLFGDEETPEKFQSKTLIKLIEDQNLEKDLAKIVGRTWQEIEESLKPDRKPRYS